MTRAGGGRSGAMLVLLAGFGLTPPSAAQTVREYHSSRPLGSESRLAVELELHQGVWTVGTATGHQLYVLDASYQSGRYRPVSRLGPGGTLKIGLESTRRGPVRLPAARTRQQGSVRLSPDVDLDLVAVLAGTRITLDLGGLRLSRLQLRAAGGETTLRFSDQNSVLCAGADLALEAGDLVVERFANSGCRSLRVTGGIGNVSLDFSGESTADIQADLSLTVGELVLRVPRAVGVLVAAERFLTTFASSGLSQEGGAWRSPGYAEASRRVDLRIASTVGAVRVEWLD